MGQSSRKKRGRPPKADPETLDTERGLRRSLRRRNVKYVFELDDYFDDDELFEKDNDRRRKLKKLKLLLELQSSGEVEPTAPQRKWSRREEPGPTKSASSSEDGGKPSKYRKINIEIDENRYYPDDNFSSGAENIEEMDAEVRERKKEPLAENSHSGTLTEASHGLPLPDKKVLELVLNKLQKKDIYGVYAEPVDPEELPDYHDVIKHPMDFATVRNKLLNGSYKTMEQFERDVFLICSNAMQYNEPDTIYHKQAHSIKELALKKFHKMRLKAETTKKDVKPVQRMRHGNDYVPVEGNYFLTDNLDKEEESLSGRGALPRFGTRSFVQDENRRDTYNPPFAISEPMFSTFEGSKHLVPVGLYSDFSYARSMARFAASLGSVAWKFTSKIIEQVLPQGVEFGRGWVGEYESLPAPMLILQNCTVKEPPFFAKVKPVVYHRKFENALGQLGAGPVSENGLPSLFLSPRIMPRGSSNLSNQQQKSQSRASVRSDEKNFKHCELTGLPSIDKKAAEPIRCRQNSTISEMEGPNFNELTSNNINYYSPSETFKQPDYCGGKAACCRPHELGQVHLMRMLADKGQNHQIPLNESMIRAASSQALPSAPPYSIINSSTHDMLPPAAQVLGYFPSFGGMHDQPERTEIQYHNQPMGYRHLAIADSSRLPVHSTWWSRPNFNTPSSASPGGGSPSSGILSDLALQFRQYI